MIKALEEESKTHHILFLDKNFPPNAIGKLFTDIKAKARRVIKIAVAPEIKEKLEQFPFSIPSIVQCLHWLINRADHYTLNNEDPLL